MVKRSELKRAFNKQMKEKEKSLSYYLVHWKYTGYATKGPYSTKNSEYDLYLQPTLEQNPKQVQPIFIY